MKDFELKIYNENEELVLSQIIDSEILNGYQVYNDENFTQILEESLIEYINENTDIDENEIDYYKLTD